MVAFLFLCLTYWPRSLVFFFHFLVHPDNLELYVGMHAEAAKPSQAGSGLAPGYTISRAILSDAGSSYFFSDNFISADKIFPAEIVALTRGDRHYTTGTDFPFPFHELQIIMDCSSLDYNVAALTAWGFEDATPDVDGGSFGGCVGKVSIFHEKREWAQP